MAAAELPVNNSQLFFSFSFLSFSSFLLSPHISPSLSALFPSRIINSVIFQCTRGSCYLTKPAGMLQQPEEPPSGFAPWGRTGSQQSCIKRGPSPLNWLDYLQHTNRGVGRLGFKFCLCPHQLRAAPFPPLAWYPQGPFVQWLGAWF